MAAATEICAGRRAGSDDDIQTDSNGVTDMSIEPKNDRPVERSRLDLLMLLGGAGASAACLGGPSEMPRRAPAATTEEGERGGGGEGSDGGGH